VLVSAVFGWLWEALRWTWHDPDGYNFISGPLADITLLGGAYAILRRHNCAVKGCLRIGRHPVAGTDHIVCRKHHPHESPSAEQVLAEHAASKHREAVTAVGAAATAAEVAATSAAGAPAPAPGEPAARDDGPA